MEIQQHDGVVVDVAGIPTGLRQAQAGRRGVAGGEGGAQGCRLLPSLPPLFIGPLGGGASPWEIRSPRGAAAKWGGRGALPPKARGKLPPRVPNPRRMGGGPRGAHQPTRGWFPCHFSPWGPPGQVAPPGGPPGPFRWSRYVTDKTRNFLDGRNSTSYI